MPLFSGTFLRVGRRAAPPRWAAPTGLVLTVLLALPSAAGAQLPSVPGFPLPGAPAVPLPLPLPGSTGCSTPSATKAPFLQVVVNGACTDLSSLLQPAGTGIWNLNTTLSLTDATVSVQAQFQSDPFITFSAATKNLTSGPTSYAFFFGTPVLPGNYTSASSSGGVSLSPGAGQNASVSPSSMYPAMIAGYGTQGPYATNLGVDLGTTSCVATGTATSTCNFGTANSTFASTYFDNLEALLIYTQTDSLSAAGFSGRVDLFAEEAPPSTVPEPGSLALLGTGLVPLVGMLRRRERRRS